MSDIIITGNPQSNSTMCRILPSLCGGGGVIGGGTINSTFPSSGSTPITVTTNPVTGQPQITQNAGNQSIQQWINAALSGLALIRGAGYVPTTTPPPQQPIIYANPNPNNSGGGFNSTGGNLGDSIQNFVTNNTGVILVGVAAYILLMSGRKK